MKRTILVIAFLLSCAFQAGAQDFDGDGIADAVDNCSEYGNPQQMDPDLDGYGNSCDADFDQDGDVDQADVDFYVNCTDPVCDLNEDGIVDDGFPAFGRIGQLFGLPPGPSGLDCAGTVPCLPPAAVPALGGAALGGLALILVASAVAARRVRASAIRLARRIDESITPRGV